MPNPLLLISVKNGGITEALDLLQDYNRDIPTHPYHINETYNIKMTTLVRLMHYLKNHDKAPSAVTFMKIVFLEYRDYPEFLNKMVSQLESGEVEHLILDFNQDETTESIADNIQESFCNILKNEGKNYNLWDCEISLKRGSAYDEYAWERYEEAGCPFSEVVENAISRKDLDIHKRFITEKMKFLKLREPEPQSGKKRSREEDDDHCETKRQAF